MIKRNVVTKCNQIGAVENIKLCSSDVELAVFSLWSQKSYTLLELSASFITTSDGVIFNSTRLEVTQFRIESPPGTRFCPGFTCYKFDVGSFFSHQRNLTRALSITFSYYKPEFTTIPKKEHHDMLACQSCDTATLNITNIAC